MKASLAALVSLLSFPAGKTPDLPPVVLLHSAEPSICVDIPRQPLPPIHLRSCCHGFGVVVNYPEDPICVLDLFGGQSGFESLLDASSVEIRPLRRIVSGHTESFVEDQGIELETANLEELKRILVSDASYLWSADGGYLDYPDGGDFRILIGKGERILRLELSLKSGALRWHNGTEWDITIKLTDEAYGRVLSVLFDSFYFDPYVTQKYAEWLTSR
jgi:hypothetical protein